MDLIECTTLVSLVMKSKQDPGNVDYLRRSKCGGTGTNITACCPVEDLREDLDRKAKSLLPSRAVCGQHSVKGMLSEDNITPLTEFPWTIQYWYSHGMLINKSFLLDMIVFVTTIFLKVWIIKQCFYALGRLSIQMWF